MLRRHSSRRVDRRKSTSSAHSKHDSIDPELARHHAQVAATLAFNRALDKGNADAHHRASGLSHSYRPSDHQPPLKRESPSVALHHGIKRQQSVRFAGPDAVQRRPSLATRASNPTLQAKASTRTLRPIAMTTHAPVPATYRPPSRSSSIGKATTNRFMATNALDEYYTKEDDVASTPSSYRRIRRTKSMFSPLKAPAAL
jgi:hypothetical protein